MINKQTRNIQEIINTYSNLCQREEEEEEEKEEEEYKV